MSIASRTSNTVELALDSAASGAVKHPRARLRAVSRNDQKVDRAAGAETADPASPASERQATYPDLEGDAGPSGPVVPSPPCEADRNRDYFSP